MTNLVAIVIYSRFLKLTKMKFKQILLILLVFALTSVKAQNCLDDVHLNLPQDINWEVQKVHFENDSLRRQQEWLVKDEKGAFKMNFVIFSVDKSEPNMSLAEVKEGLLKRPREKHEVTRLGESELKGDYSLETYKVIAAHKVRNSRGSF